MVPSAEVRTGSWPESTKSGVAIAARSSRPSAALTAERSEAGACTTSEAVVPSDGNSSAICLTVCTSGIEAGSVSRLPEWIFMPSAGSGQQQDDDAGDHERDRRVAQHGRQDAAADPAAGRSCG